MSGRRFREMEENRTSKRHSRYPNNSDDSSCYRYNSSLAWRDRHSNHISRYENHDNKYRRNNDRYYDNGYKHNFKDRNYETSRRYYNNDRSRSPQFRGNHRRVGSYRSKSFSRSRSPERNNRQHYPSDRDGQMRYRNNYNPKRENHQRNRFNDNHQQNKRIFNDRRYQNKRKRSDERGHEDDTKSWNTERHGSDQKNDKKSRYERNEICEGRNHDEEARRTDDGYLEDEKDDQPQQDNAKPMINYDEEDDRTIKRRKIDDVFTENIGKLASGLQYEINETGNGNQNEDIYATDGTDLENQLLSEEEHDPPSSGFLNDMLRDEKTNLDD